MHKEFDMASISPFAMHYDYSKLGNPKRSVLCSVLNQLKDELFL